MQMTWRAASSSAKALVSTGPPHTANGSMSAMAWASARAATSSMAVPVARYELELHLAAVGLVVASGRGRGSPGRSPRSRPPVSSMPTAPVMRLEDRVVVDGEVDDDLDGVAGDARGGGPAVVALDVGVAGRREVGRDGDPARLLVAARRGTSLVEAPCSSASWKEMAPSGAPLALLLGRSAASSSPSSSPPANTSTPATMASTTRMATSGP